MIKSMTGFARKQIQSDLGIVSWEIRTVNSRYLDANFRLPEIFRELEMTLRTLVSKYLKRGKIDCTLSVYSTGLGYEEIQLNRQELTQFKTVIQAVGDTFSNSQMTMSLDVLELLQRPGITQRIQRDMSGVHRMILSVFESALHELEEQREREGEQLVQFFMERLTHIENKVGEAKHHLPEILKVQREHIVKNVRELLTTVDEHRLEQEMVYWAQKMDVSEELDRLVTHIHEVRRLLSNGGAVGRHMDFMMQEFNREANTLASKSFSEITTRIAVDIKVLVEQMREQTQNLE